MIVGEKVTHTENNSNFKVPHFDILMQKENPGVMF